MLPEIFKHFKGTSGHANGNCQSFVGVSKANETLQHWVCAQRVLQQHKQDVQWKHRMTTKSAHVEHDVSEGRKKL